MAATNATTRTAKVKFDGEARGLVSAARRAERAMEGVGKKSRIMTGALTSIGGAAVSMGPKLVAAFAAAPAVAAAAATGMVLAFGGVLAGIGIAAAAQNREVKKQFRDLKKHVVGTLKEISKPFRGTLDTIATSARKVFNSFVPSLKGAFKRMAPTISGFVRQFGGAFRKLRPAIKPLTEAFNAILRQLGPMMKPLFKEISDALIQLAGVVKKNKTEFSLFLGMALRLIPKTIRFIATLAKGFGAFVRAAPGWGASFLGVIRKMLGGVRTWVRAVLNHFDRILNAADATFGKLPGPIGDAVSAANDRFDRFRRGVDDTFRNAERTLRGWEGALRRLPKQVKLRGEISDLRSKIASAKARLRTVPKSKRSDIRGRIDDLRAKVRDAKRELAGIPDYKSVTIDAQVTRDFVRFSGSGSIPRRAHGGSVSAGRTYLVGEQGPELVTMGGNGHVTPNHKLGDQIIRNYIQIGDEVVRVVDSRISESHRGLRRRALAGAPS